LGRAVYFFFSHLTPQYIYSFLRIYINGLQRQGNIYLIHFTLTPHEPYLMLRQFHLIKAGVDTVQQTLFEYLHRILFIYLANLIYLVVEVLIPLYAHLHNLMAHRGIILPRYNDHSSTSNYQSRMIFDLWQPLFSAND